MHPSDADPRLEATYRLLNSLGITANYAGFPYTACAVQLCLAQPERLRMVTKWVYPEVARRYRTSWKAVERNIRVASGMAWSRNRPLLEALAGRKLPEKPRAAQLLAILSCRLQLDADGPAALQQADGADPPAAPER